ncbi:MAG TPA: mobile mystery protein A [Rhodanobacteraceae bacterium]|nr:mobile mystery protein A [Rhodanobacteraceae bacterium]
MTYNNGCDHNSSRENTAIPMPKATQIDLVRLRLDERLAAWRDAGTLRDRPKTGWIAAIRKALGMTRAQLGRRLGITEASVADAERSEKDDRIRLDTLRRTAAALDCELIYALVPRKSLAAMIDARMNAIAEAEYRRTAHSMALEDQLEDDAAGRELKLKAIRDAITLRELWRE